MKNKFHLEEFVKNNYDLFNDEEPDEGHFERFKTKLDRHSSKKKKKILRLSVKYTSVAALIIFGLILFKHSDDILKSKNISEEKNVTIETNDDFNEISVFYNSQINKKMLEIEQLECKENLNKKEILNNDLSELTSSFQELKNEYKNNPGNEKIQNALIYNYQMRINVLDLIVKKLKIYC